MNATAEKVKRCLRCELRMLADASRHPRLHKVGIKAVASTHAIYYASETFGWHFLHTPATAAVFFVVVVALFTEGQH